MSGSDEHTTPDTLVARSLLRALPYGFAIVDAGGHLLEVNDHLCDLTGRTADELVASAPPHSFVPDEHRLALGAAVRAATGAGGDAQPAHAADLRHRSGALVAVEVHLAPLDGAPDRAVALVRDASRDQRDQDWLEEAHRVARMGNWEYLPHLDRVYGSPELERRAGFGDGHRTILDGVGRIPSPYRERFCEALAAVVDGRIEEVRLEYPTELPGLGRHWTESRMWPVKDADGAVVRVRGTSRHLEPEPGAAVSSGGAQVATVRSALAEDRFELHAQPIVELATGHTVQHELLIRMREHDGNVVAPGEFLPAAEASGLIVDIDNWVVDQAIAYAAMGNPVELNLSARSICSCEMVERLRSRVRGAGVDPALIVIELTETALVEDEAAAERFIREAGALGCRVALDDFGTGYSGFTYLKRLPVDYLKIDKEFVLDLTTNEASRRVVEAVVSLARGFGQLSVAEGAEDQATLDLLRELGVDYAQGYGIARPAPAAQVLRTHAAGNSPAGD